MYYICSGVDTMPRQMRKLSQSKIYHVMIRGNEKKDIFLDDEDRERFLHTIREKNKEKKWHIYAYCLMGNHVHLLINEGTDTISGIMQRINISYAYYFNKKYKRVGHLLQDRYRSENIEDDSYLIAAMRYIHNNPVKSGMVERALQYRWSSLRVYLELSSDHVGIDRSTVLGIFSENENRAIELLLEFSKQESNDIFVDYEENDAEINDGNAGSFVEGFLDDYGLTKRLLKSKKNRVLKKHLIKELKTRSSLSMRQIAGLLDISRDVVRKVINELK
jgi:REP element-mobilizing transposase RayT